MGELLTVLLMGCFVVVGLHRSSSGCDLRRAGLGRELLKVLPKASFFVVFYCFSGRAVVVVFRPSRWD